MNLFVLYLLLLRATLTSFSGLTSLPVVRNDLVVTRHLITDRQLNAAVAIGRTAPGPNGLYLVSLGYFVAGWPGALMGWAAMATPALLIVPMLQYLGRRAERPKVRSAIRAVTFAAAGLVVGATAPLARDALTGPLPLALALASFLVLTLTRLDTFWVILASAAAGLLAALL